MGVLDIHMSIDIYAYGPGNGLVLPIKFIAFLSLHLIMFDIFPNWYLAMAYSAIVNIWRNSQLILLNSILWCGPFGIDGHDRWESFSHPFYQRFMSS